MDRVVLEKAWLDSYDFSNRTIEEKVKKLSETPAAHLASQVYSAAMKLRDEGINWYGSAFEEELLEIISKGDSALTAPDVHLSVEEYKEIINFLDDVEQSGLDDALANAKAKSAAQEKDVENKNNELEM